MDKSQIAGNIKKLWYLTSWGSYVERYTETTSGKYYMTKALLRMFQPYDLFRISLSSKISYFFVVISCAQNFDIVYRSYTDIMYNKFVKQAYLYETFCFSCVTKFLVFLLKISYLCLWNIYHIYLTDFYKSSLEMRLLS